MTDRCFVVADPHRMLVVRIHVDGNSERHLPDHFSLFLRLISMAIV